MYCAGISYSPRAGYTGQCYVCKDERLSNDGNDFGFYARQGTLRNNYISILVALSPIHDFIERNNFSGLKAYDFFPLNI